MDDLEKCEQESKTILKKVKSAFKEVNQELLCIQNNLNNSEFNSDEETISLEENIECLDKNAFSENKDISNEAQSDLKQIKLHTKNNDFFANDETKLFDEISPVKSNSIPSRLNPTPFRVDHLSVQIRSSTPNLLKKKHEKGARLRQTGDSVKSNDSEGLWSIDSKPTAIGTSKTSTTMDFHLVETVLPTYINTLNVNEKISCKDLENDELSDGSQSHTVFTITKLVSSLNEEKKKNNELMEKLTLTENELAAFKIEMELEEAERKQENTGKLADLVEEIYAAQKEREHAMIERLKFANKERDEALIRAKAFAKDSRYYQTKENNNEFYDSKNLRELLDAVCTAESGRAAEKYGKDIISHISQLKVEKDRITNEEMSTVIKERDAALHKSRAAYIKLEEIKDATKRENIQSKNEMIYPDDSMQLHQDKINEKLLKTQQELETLRTYYNLHKSHIDRNEVLTMRDLQEKGDADRLAHALRIAQEHNSIQETNARRQDVNIRRLKERNEKLERLVAVLRKKVSILAQKSAQQVAESSGYLTAGNQA